jgi:hypothetical protein
MRLAKSHTVSIKTLFMMVLLPNFSKDYLFPPERSRSSTFWEQNTRSFNSLNQWSREMVRIVEACTGQTGLANLTMLPFQQVFGNRNLVKASLNWCPICLESFHRGSEIFFPLSWQLSAVRFCTKHMVRLIDHCPWCDQTVPFLSPTMKPGFCPRCHKPLWPKKQQADSQNQGIADWESWASIMTEDLINRTQSLKDEIPFSNLAEAIEICVTHFSDGSINQFAGLACVGATSVRDWLAGKQKILLPTLLRVCGRLGIVPFDLIAMKKIEKTAKVIIPARNASKKGPSQFCKKALESELNKTLQSVETPPPTMIEIARRLDHDRSHLYRLFPEKCKAISKRARAFGHQRYEKRLHAQCQLLEKAFENLIEIGLFPSERAVKETLEQPGIMRHPVIRAHYERLRSELMEVNRV